MVVIGVLVKYSTHVTALRVTDLVGLGTSLPTNGTARSCRVNGTHGSRSCALRKSFRFKMPYATRFTCGTAREVNKGEQEVDKG